MITSVQNERVKRWRKLHQKKGRQKARAFLIESIHLIEEAFHSDWAIKEVIVKEDYHVPQFLQNETIYTVANNVFQALAQTKTPQGIAAVIEMKTVEKISQEPEKELILLIDRIQDPGNLGTIIRTADAVGCSEIILGHGTVDLFNDKVVRATQGSLFHLPIKTMDLKEAIFSLQQKGFTVWASTLEGAQNIYEMERSKKMAIIVGNEGQGVHRALLQLADEKVKIPIYGAAESLNVSVATGILLYEMRK